MKILDVNVVVAAYRDDHPQHAAARQWLEQTAAESRPFAVTDGVAASLVGIVTNRKIVEKPAPIADAFAFIRALRGQPEHRAIAPGPRHLDIFERMCRDSDATGDLVPDAQLAALAVEHAGEIVSFDRDFGRFGVRWSRPGAASR